jgi:acyl-CoA thioesterase
LPESSNAQAPTDPQALAEAVGEHMFKRDLASQMLGMKIESIGPGAARLSMRVRPDMLNGHRICHGGFIFTLADSCFAFACNSRNHSTVAAACMIDFLAPAEEGDLLIAQAKEQSLAGRSGVYDIAVSHADGRTIALFRGKSRRIAGEVLGDAPQSLA